MIRKLLFNTPYSLQMLLLACAAFGCYTSMYAYRKAFTAAVFGDMPLMGVDYKVWLVIAQVFGYMLSKFYGIKYVSELGQHRRGVKLLTLIALAWVALLGFALCPVPYNIIFMFANGLPLGMIWGIVFSYLEGRRTTEFLAAVMSVSLVFASGFVKTLARFVMESVQLPAHWMPFAMGLLFVLPLLFFTALLENLPPADAKDKLLRTERKVMTHLERVAFVKRFLPGLLLVITVYLIFTILRDVRDNFEVEIWTSLGVIEGGVYLRTDAIIAVVVLVLMSILICIKGNMKAFSCIHGLLFLGCLLAAASTGLLQLKLMDAETYMVVTGLGLFMVYIPFNAIFFERFLATFKVKGNIGFVMYLADSVGYLGSVGVLLVKELGSVERTWADFFQRMLLFAACVGGILVIFSFVYFRRKKQGSNREIEVVELA